MIYLKLRRHLRGCFTFQRHESEQIIENELNVKVPHNHCFKICSGVFIFMEIFKFKAECVYVPSNGKIQDVSCITLCISPKLSLTDLVSLEDWRLNIKANFHGVEQFPQTTFSKILREVVAVGLLSLLLCWQGFQHHCFTGRTESFSFFVSRAVSKQPRIWI